MIKKSADTALAHLYDAFQSLEKASLETLFGDDGTGNDFATQSQIQDLKIKICEIQEKIIKEAKK